MKGKSQLIAEALYRAEPEAQRVLDVGYAQNPSTFLRGDVYGIDIVADEHPASYKEVKHVDLNDGQIPYADGFFDAVAMGCVLAHVANPVQLLEELHRVLKPNGVLVFSSPNPNYYWENVLNIFYHHFKARVSKAKHVEHFTSFTRYNVRTLADRVGFTLEEEVGMSFRLVKTKFAFHPFKYPGLGYEIIYVLRKTGEPEHYTTCELPGRGIVKVPTHFRADGNDA